MVAALGEDDGVAGLRDGVGVGLPFGVVGGVLHIDGFVLDFVDLLRDFPVLVGEASLQVGVGELRAQAEEDIDLIDEVGLGGGADFEFHAFAGEGALHHRVVRFRVADILHEALALQFGDEGGHGAVHADAEELHRLGLCIADKHGKDQE